jgi:uncharacterized protein
LGEKLGLPVRFKPILPLGRATGQGLTPEPIDSFDDAAEALARVRVSATCGLGMNLYVAPDGAAFPCFALVSAPHGLGNVLADGLDAVLERNTLYRSMGVDADSRCCTCALRYLCGGLCRAWGEPDARDTTAADCTLLHRRACSLLLEALATLAVTPARWLAAGLPFPESATPRMEKTSLQQKGE